MSTKFSPIKFRAAHGYDTEAASNESAVGDFGPSLTVQSMAEDADINVLVERFGITGKMPVNPRVPMYGDFTGIMDFKSALSAVSDAYDSFMLLPAKVRARFENNPQKLLDFVSDDANIKEAQMLGLLKEKDHDGGSQSVQQTGADAGAAAGKAASVAG